MTFEQAKKIQAIFDGEVSRLSEILNAFPRGPMGLTPENVRATLDYKIAKTQFDAAFTKLRNFNGAFSKTFKSEIAEDRRLVRQAQDGGCMRYARAVRIVEALGMSVSDDGVAFTVCGGQLVNGKLAGPEISAMNGWSVEEVVLQLSNIEVVVRMFDDEHDDELRRFLNG